MVYASKFWTPENLALAQQRAAQGVSYRSIAIEMGVSIGAIAGKLKRLKSPGERKARTNGWTPELVETLLAHSRAGLSYRDIAALMGRSVEAIRCQLKERRSPDEKKVKPMTTTFWTPEHLEILTSGHAKGLNMPQLAERLGVPQSTISSKCKRLGLKFRNGNVGRARKPRPKVESAPLRAAAAYAGEPVVELAPIFTPESPVTHEEPMFTGGVAIWELRTVHCRYIVRGGGSGGVASFDPHEVRYCGETVSAGSWCATHRKLFCHSVYEARKMRAEADSE